MDGILTACLETGRFLAGYVFCTLAILGVGQLVLGRLLPDTEETPQTEWYSLSWLLGAAVFSLLILALAATHFVHRWSLGALCVAGIVCGRLARRPRVTATEPAGFLERAACGVAVVFLAVYFVAAMAPSQDSDGYRYHLGFPHLYRAAGGLIRIETDFYAAFPQGMEMLYLCALEFGGFSAANLLHWNFLAATAALLWSLGARHRAAAAGAWSAAAICSSSVVGTTAASTSVDVALAAAVLGAFHAWLRWLEAERRGWLITAALASGFACAVKYTGVTALLFAAVVLAAGRASARNWALAAAVSAVPFAPWLARNWIFYSNPFMPFLNAWFPNPHFSAASEAAWMAVLRNFNGARFNGSYLWEFAIRGVTTMGFAGPFVLLAPVALLSLGTRLGWWVLCAAALTSLPWLLGNPIARFAIPALPFLALCIALGVRKAIRPALATAVLVLTMLVHAAMNFPPFIERWNKQWIIAIKQIPWRPAFRLIRPEQYWREALPSYPLLEYAEAHLPPDARILSFDEQYQFFTTRLISNFYSSEHVSAAANLLFRANNEGGTRRATAEVRRRGWTHLLATQQFPWARAAIADPARWGVRVLCENRGVYLLEIE